MGRRRKLKKKWRLFFIFVVTAGIVCIVMNKPFKFGTKDVEPKVEDQESAEEKIENTPKKESVKLTLVGDFLFESPLYKDIDKTRDGDKYFKRVKTKYFDTDDITIGNLEVPIGNENMQVSGDGFNFCAPEAMGDLIAKQSIEFLGTANNHSYDRKIEGIESTIKFFKEKTNIMTAGTYMSDEDRSTPRIMEKEGIKFGFLAYTLGTNVTVPSEYRNRVAFFRNPDNGTFESEYKTKMTEEIKSLREKVDVLIVLMHWGAEFTYSPNTQQKEVAKYLNSLKVDIVVGAHSHCMQPIEWVGEEYKTLVYYSMGNFVSADDDISRTAPGNEEFDNSYQVGLLSTLDIKKETDGIKIDNIKTEPIINYFDTSLRFFELIPLSEYTDTHEKGHYRYSYGLTKDFITNTYNKVISTEFRS